MNPPSRRRRPPAGTRTRETANDEDADDAADVDVDAADTKIPVGGPGANDPLRERHPSARVLELLARQEAEHWPAQGSDEWLLARARIVSASEASAALGVDRFRSPEKLIRDKLARLDHLEAVPRDALAAAAESFDAAAREKANDLGWRANGGKKGDKNARKKKRRGKRGRGGVGGRRFAGANELQRVLPGGASPRSTRRGARERLRTRRAGALRPRGVPDRARVRAEDSRHVAVVRRDAGWRRRRRRDFGD